MKQYLIKWKKPIHDDETHEIFDWDSKQCVKSLNEKELNSFIKDKRKVKIKEIKDNPVPSIDSLTENELDIIKSSLQTVINGAYANRLHEVKDLLDKLQIGVETDKEKPIYEIECIDINATDRPIRIRIKDTLSYKIYLVESLAWNLISNNQDVLHYVYNNFDCEIS